MAKQNSARRVPKGYSAKEEHINVSSLSNKLLSAQTAIAKAWPILERQTEGSKMAGMPVPLDKSGKRCLLYGKGALSRRKQALACLSKAVQLLTDMGLSSKIVSPLPQMAAPAAPAKKGKSGKK